MTDELVARTLDTVPDGVEGVVSVRRVRHGLARFASSAIHQHVEEDRTEVALTVAVDGRVGDAATTMLDDLHGLVARAVAAARLQPVDPHWAGVAPAEVVTDPAHHDPATAEAGAQDRVARVRDFLAEGPGLDGAGFADSEAVEVALGTTAGQRVTGAATKATVDGIFRTRGAAGMGHATASSLAGLDAGRVGARAAELTRRGVDAQHLPAEPMEVVLAPEAVATIAVFLGFYGFSAKAQLDGDSSLERGQERFDPAITMVDDVFDPRALGLGFDGEGTPRSTVTLVSAGTVGGALHDRRTAARSGEQATGHSPPPGPFGGIGPLPAQLVLRPGHASPDELVGEVERGLLVTSFNYCRVLDPRTLATTGLTRNGTFLIEDGEVTAPVADLRFTQSFIDALGPGRVLGIGSDDRHATSDFGEGMTIVPSLRLSSWAFTGDASG